MLRKIMLENSAGITLGILSVEEKDHIVHFGGAYFARHEGHSSLYQGETIPLFFQQESIYHANKLDIDFVAMRADAVNQQKAGAEKP